MEKVEKRKSFIINFVFFGIILALVFILFRYFFWVAAPFLLSFFFAMILQKPLRYLDKKTKNKAHVFWSIALVVISICVVIIPLIFILASVFSKISEFVKYLMDQLSDLPAFLAKAENWLLDLLDFLPENIYASVSNTITDWFDDLQPVATEEAGSATNFLSKIDFSSVTSKIGTGVSSVFSVIKGLPSALIGIVIGVVAWILFTKDYNIVVSFIQKQLPSSKQSMMVEIKQLFSKTLRTLFKAYGVIMTITFGELVLGFTVLRLLGIMENSYYVLIAAVIAVFDILPVAGSGGILIPWALFSFVNGNYKQAIGLIIIYVIITIIREYIEPKIVGSSLGVNPIVTLMGLYFGLKIFGFIGMFLVPLVVMTLKALNDAGRIKLWHSANEIERN